MNLNEINVEVFDYLGTPIKGANIQIRSKQKKMNKIIRVVLFIMLIFSGYNSYSQKSNIKTVFITVKNSNNENIENAVVTLVFPSYKKKIAIPYSNRDRAYIYKDSIISENCILTINCDGYESYRRTIKFISEKTYPFVLLKDTGIKEESGIRVEKDVTCVFGFTTHHALSLDYKLFYELYEADTSKITDTIIKDLFKGIRNSSFSIAYSNRNLVLLRANTSCNNSDIKKLQETLYSCSIVSDFGEAKILNNYYQGFNTNRYLIYWKNNDTLQIQSILKKYHLKLLNDNETNSYVISTNFYENENDIELNLNNETIVEKVERVFLHYKALD
ncbi:hypothetical protein D3C87_83250 [compost metagenome]